MNDKKNPDPSRYSNWCEHGQHWHVLGATYGCGEDPEVVDKVRQYNKEEDERHRPELLKKLEAQIARLKAEHERLKNK